MISHIIQQAEKYNSPRLIVSVLILWILFNVGFSFAFKGLDENIPDTMLWYDSEKVYSALDGFNEEEKKQYVRGMLYLDFLYPLVYSTLLILLLTKLKASALSVIFPVIAVIFDYLENLSILFLITRLPARINFLADLSGFFTLFKWLSVGFSVVIILIYFTRSAFRRY